jgi:hypothetical protein
VRRGRVVAGAVAAASVAGVVWKRGRRRRERVDLYFEDGSMVSLAGDSAEARLLIPYAREALRAAAG